MRDRDRYLKQRDERYYYLRRVPRKLAPLDARGTVRVALKTASIAEARQKRDQLEKADDLYWAALSTGHKAAALKRYHAAVERALAHGFGYMPAPELADQAALDEILARIDALNTVKDNPTTQAVLGHVPRPKPTVSEAFDIYVNEITPADVTSTSPAQQASWRKVKQRAAAGRDASGRQGIALIDDDIELGAETGEEGALLVDRGASGCLQSPAALPLPIARATVRWSSGT